MSSVRSTFIVLPLPLVLLDGDLRAALVNTLGDEIGEGKMPPPPLLLRERGDKRAGPLEGEDLGLDAALSGDGGALRASSRSGKALVVWPEGLPSDPWHEEAGDGDGEGAGKVGVEEERCACILLGERRSASSSSPAAE